MPKESFIALVSGEYPADIVGHYHDPSSGCRFVVARPEAQPALWQAYLDGARINYRKHGVESALEYDVIRDGHSTALFVVALDTDGRIVGGMRMQGRYGRPEDAHAVQEWADRAGTAQLISEISDRLADGVIEMKTGWVSDQAAYRDELSAALARFFIYSLTLMNVRYAMCTVAGHAVKRWETTGGVVSPNVASVAYPDDRYRTVVMWWDRESVADLAGLSQLPLLVHESAQLAANPPPAGSPLVPVLR